MVGLSTGVGAFYYLKYDFRMFFAGLFDNIDILEVKQQLSCTFNVVPTNRTCFTQLITNSADSNTAEQVIANVTGTLMFANLCAP